MTDGTSPVVTPSEFAELLRVPVARVYAGCRSEEIPCIRLGRLIRIPLEKALHELSQGSANEMASPKATSATPRSKREGREAAAEFFNLRVA